MKLVGKQKNVCPPYTSGYSSLGYLSRFPIDRLKVDQFFVRGVDRLPVNAAILRAITALAKSLSLHVVAEGVETEAELAMVRECGCDESQGYLHSRPVPAERFTTWLQEVDRFHQALFATAGPHGAG